MANVDYGAWSLLPPVLAIILAIVTQRVVFSLLAGVVVGAIMLDARPMAVAANLMEGLLWANFLEEGHLRVFCFTLIMGAMVGVIRHAGGMQAIVEALAPMARSRRGGQLLTWLLGIAVFIDDYASCLLIGNTMRPLADRLRISREKLAYIVDSTAAPVSGLALVSTWIAAEIGAIEEGLKQLQLADTVDGMDLFIRSIPYRFYVLWTLILVGMIAWLRRDFGPMLTAERRALIEPPAEDAAKGEHRLAQLPAGRWWVAVGPVLLTIGVTLSLLMVTGRSALIKQHGAAPSLTTLSGWAQTFGNGNSNLSLLYGSLCGWIAAAVWAWQQRALTTEELQEASYAGARQVVPALAILWLAWTLSDLTDQQHLGSGAYLANLLRSSVDVRWMPTLVFVLSSTVSFSTGTSWGTMSLLMPLVVPTVFRMLHDEMTGEVLYHPIMLASIGGVLSGAIFGDHCSPISDTTVLSSQASGCRLIAHVRTQLPYALLIAFWAIVLGTIPVGLGAPASVLLPAGVVAVAAVLIVLGRNPEHVCRRQPVK